MYDVVIAGAGPVGLYLACELRLAGCDVLVLERDAAESSPLKEAPAGLRGLSAGSVESFNRRGMLADLFAASRVDDYPGPDEPWRPTGQNHFAGMMFDLDGIDGSTLPFRVRTPTPEGILTNLHAVQSVLADRAVKLGVDIRRGLPVTGVDQDPEGVTVRSDAHEFRGRWLVGCDGGRSVVRKLAGFEFTGTGPQFTGYLMLVDMTGADELRFGFTLTPTGMYLRAMNEHYVGMMDFDGGAYDRSRTPDREHLQEILRRVSGTDVTIDAVHLVSTFTDRAMQVTEYRRGRILLAGDAAHIHSPLGGQGLNSGIGDAVNLGWKLAATVRGDAPDGLLDTYGPERHPIGARVVDWTRVQVATMRPDPHSQAIQRMVRDLIATPDGAAYVFHQLDTMTGLALRYDLGSDDPFTGRDCPEFRLADGTRLADLMHDGRGVLLDFTGSLASAATPWRSKLMYAPGPARDDLGFTAVLVRPDGIVAWAAREGDHAGFEQAARRWFGSPTA